jgi:hypothetical protein
MMPLKNPSEKRDPGELRCIHVLDCPLPAISLLSHHVSLVQWTTRLLLVTSDPGLNPLGGSFSEAWILLLALPRNKNVKNCLEILPQLVTKDKIQLC